MKTLTVLFLSALPLLAAEEKPIALFNGTDLSGWTFDSKDDPEGAKAAWTVRDGHLVTVGKPVGVIRSEKDYENYELTLRWRWPAGSKPGNSGVLLHATTPRHAGVWPNSIEAQLHHEDAGDLWMIGVEAEVEGGKLDGRRWHKKAESNEKAPGEWNHMRVVCKGDTIQVYVNDVLQNEGKNLTATKGAICLQAEGAPIEFQNILLSPLE